MEDKDKLIQELFSRLELLTRQQRSFQEEIQKIHLELVKLKQPFSTPEPERPVAAANPPREPIADTATTKSTGVPPSRKEKIKTPWEDFIGTNLLNKVGITVLVLGIGFGAKYSIDHNLINPLTRIVLGYLAGAALVAVAFRLREAHKGFSAVLLSGGMAVLYFITYSAYSFYGLMPQPVAFVLMVIFTFFTVFAAVHYNMEVIGIIGLAGAYAVPILLSDGSGRVLILFTYISIINCGILFLAFRKYWKRLYYIAFILTWFTFASWYAFSFDRTSHISISLAFSTIFFLTFYITFLAYKLIRKEELGKWDIVCMLFNSFIYFGYGYLTVDAIDNGEEYLGLFAVVTALMHFVACLVIYKTQSRYSDIFYFVAGMVLVFLTIAVPIQLEGNWVTLVWAAEAALMFWVGRSKSFPTYEKLSYPLIALAFLSLLHDWSETYPGSYYYQYDDELYYRIFLNIQFLTSMLVAASFVLILAIKKKYDPADPLKKTGLLTHLPGTGLPIVTLFVVYVGIYKEIEVFWDQAYAASRIEITGSGDVHYNDDLLNFKQVWLIMYSAIFAAGLFVLQRRWRANLPLAGSIIFNAVVLLIFVTAGLLALSELRSSFLDQNLATYYSRGYGHIVIRYAAIALILPLLWFNRKLIERPLFNSNARKAVSLYFHFIVLVLLSSELIHWLDMARMENSLKLSLSILWGGYALFLIVFGLSRDEKHIRVGAMVLFAVTLAKLFVYDMEDMSTILKTVVMIILGVLLLTASFIYNKYKRSTGNETP